MIIDTHCHLDSLSFPPCFYHSYSSNKKKHQEIDAFFITMSTSSLDWKKQLELSKQFKNVYCSLGIHPYSVRESDFKCLALLKQLFRDESIVALGEVGLDFTSPYKENKTLQVEFLTEQLILAKDFDLPASLHVRKAHNEMLDILSSIAVQGVIHGLGASKELAESYIDLGFKIGVNGVVIRENARRYHELVMYFGLKHLVLETDFPHVKIMDSEKPLLSDVILVAKKIASLLNCSVEEVVDKTSLNAQKMFNLNGILDGK